MAERIKGGIEDRVREGSKAYVPGRSSGGHELLVFSRFCYVALYKGR